VSAGVGGSWIALALALLLAMPAQAERTIAAEPGYASYITPFPTTDRYRLFLFGDSLATGLIQPLTSDLAPQSIEVVNKTAPGLGLGRNDGNEWDKVIDGLPPTDGFQIAVILFGVDDRGPIRAPKRWLGPGTPEWQQEYARRVDAVLKTLHGRNVAIYWLGLPIMRGPLATAAAQADNTIFLERVRLSGAKFIDTWEGFVDADGAYADSGPDITGIVKQMRLPDGIRMTVAGYQKLANFVEREIIHDLSVAKRERDVPLAGDEAEQQNVRDESLPRAPGAGAKAAVAAKAGKGIKDTPADDGNVVAAGADGIPTNIKVVRPPIPGAVLAQVASNRGEAQTDPGQTMPTDLKGGFTVMSSIATSQDATASLKQHLPLTENPFYRLLIRGDALPAKPGRVDDFSWPKAGG